MNDWNKLTTMLQQAIPDLPDPENLRTRLAPDALAARDKAKEEDIDAAIHSFSTSGNWPLLDHDESFLIAERIRFGICVARALETPGPNGKPLFPAPPEEFTVDEQLQWLLIAAWNYAGREGWYAH